MTTSLQGRVLIIAGSDSGGGAGIQADIKTVTCLGGYAATAITALTAQNTLGVQSIHPVPAAFVAEQMRSVLTDIGADTLKTGMLLNAEIIRAIADTLKELAHGIPMILDPVMVAKGGAPLLQPEAEVALKERLLPRAFLLTPNIPEAERLTGRTIRTLADMRAALPALLAMGPRHILLKGGHLEGETVYDLLAVSKDEILEFSSPRLETRHTHGTGCTLASAMATGIALGLSLPEAIKNSRDYVFSAIQAAPGLGKGHGPLGHGFRRDR